MCKTNSRVPQPGRPRHFHAHIAFNLRHPVFSGSYSQWTGHLRGESMQEENGIRHIRAELSNSRHAVLAGDAVQHSPAGQRQAMGLWKLYVQSGGGRGCQQPVYHSGNCDCVVH